MGYKLQLGMGTSAGLENVLAEGGKILFTTDDGLLHIDTTNATDKSGRIAVNATKAKKDWLGNTISSYIKELSIDGSTITYTSGDGTAKTITTPNTTYKAGNGLTLSGTTFNIGEGTGIDVTADAVSLATSGVTAGNYGEDANATLTHSGTFVVPKITVDAYGRVTSATNYTMTLPGSGNTDTKVTQAYSTTNNSYPLLFSAVAGITSTNDRNAQTAILNNAIYANPSTGYLYATKFAGAANTADKFTVSHSITIGNQTETYDGGANATFTLAEMGVAPASHNHSAANITSGTLAIARGGTGLTAIAPGEIIYGASNNTYSRLEAGNANQILKSGGTNSPEWITPSTSLTAYKVSKQLTVGSKKYDGSEAITITAADLGVGNALHFIGIFEDLPATGNAGDVVILSTNDKEYIWNGAATSPGWEELGDEGSYVMKGTVTIQGTGALGGSGTIGDTGTISITHDTTGSAAKSNSSQTKTISGSGGSGSFTIPVIAVDTYGHTKYTGDSTVTITLPTIPTIPDHKTLTITGSSTAATSTTVGYSGGVDKYNPIGSAHITATIYSFKGATASAAGIAGLVPAPAKGVINHVLTSNGQWTAATAIGAVEWVDF